MFSKRSTPATSCPANSVTNNSVESGVPSHNGKLATDSVIGTGRRTPRGGAVNGVKLPFGVNCAAGARMDRLLPQFGFGRKSACICCNTLATNCGVITKRFKRACLDVQRNTCLLLFSRAHSHV